MKKLDQYMLKSFLGPLIMTFLIVIFVLMMQFLWLYIDELVGKGLSLGIVLEFIGWGSATLIPLALPLATLLASIMTMGNMGENNELLAMKAAGISLGRIMMPLICASVIISIGAFFISNDLIPVAWNKIYTLRDDIGSTKEEIKIPTGIFYSGVEGYTIRVEERDSRNMMHGIMLYNHSSSYHGNTNLTLADSGSVKMAENKESMILTLYDGVNYEESNELNYQDTSLVLKQVSFTMQNIVIPLKNYAFKKSKDVKYNSEVMTKSLKTLRQDRDSLGVLYDSALVNSLAREQQSSRLAYRYQHNRENKKEYKGSIDYDQLYQWSSPSEEEEALEQAAMHIENQINNLGFVDEGLFSVAYPLRRSKIESFRKFSLSLACLLFFFVGAPLGAIIRKGGLGTPVIISILFFVVYWVFDISGKKLANDAELTPFMGAFMSSFVLIPIGTFLTYKAIKDSAIFHADAYKIFFTRLKGRLSSTYDRYRNHFKVVRLLRKGAFGKNSLKK
ncbi:MAG: LptF/LptG family permease [Bacteroidales bacterium]|nr:LptF/LptG family permease [Candidatus Egerieousia equi]